MTRKTCGDEPTLRDVGRAWAQELQAQSDAAGTPDSWFEELYRRAQGNPEYIPWEAAAPRFRLTQWLAKNPGAGRTAIDIGCGLGDNAACLATAGYEVTAFDLSHTATDWASERFSDKSIRFQQADIFNLPDAWRGMFDLVHETYNLQALPQDRVRDAIREITTLVRPGGTILVMTRAREIDDTPSGPPWPLLRETLDAFTHLGMEPGEFEQFNDDRPEPVAHFLATWTRPPA